MTDRDIKEGTYGWYEKEAMEKIETLEYKQQASCKLVYIALCSLSAKNRNSSKISGWKSQIASFASVSEKSVQRCLPILQRLGIIQVAPQDRKSNGKYEKVNIWLTSNKLAAGHFEDSTGTAQGQHDSSTVRYINKEININKINKLSTSTLSQNFDIFWNQYPKKVSKQQALKAWKKLSEVEQCLALKALPKHITSDQWQKDGGQFIPYPASWLNAARWEDDLIAASSHPEFGSEFQSLDPIRKRAILKMAEQYEKNLAEVPTRKTIEYWIKTKL